MQQNILFAALVKDHFLYLKLLISQSKFVGLLEFEIMRVACICEHYKERIQSTEIYFPRGNKYF